MEGKDMGRADDDSWDLATGVGATATMVAAARAAASRGADAVADDTFAEGLVREVGVDFLTRLAAGEMDFADIGDDGGSGWMPHVFGIRARHYDQFWTSAAHAGIRQMVNVASGLDSRGYRLPWSDEIVVYEIDKPEVIEFKRSALARLDATPKTELHTVAADLRQDWPAALGAAGVDPHTAAAWIAEGLMIGFLPAEAQNRLLDDITRLSAPGSRLAADHVPGSFSVLGEQMRQIGTSWNEQGFHVDFDNLYFSGEHDNAETYLKERGWDTSSATFSDLFANADIPLPQIEFGCGVHGVVHITAIRR
jgi:methyltransferase (TIGR00027 family)